MFADGLIFLPPPSMDVFFPVIFFFFLSQRGHFMCFKHDGSVPVAEIVLGDRDKEAGGQRGSCWTEQEKYMAHAYPTVV